jgi:hypothetical protein
MSETDRCGLTGLFNYRKLQADLASIKDAYAGLG